MKKKTPNMKVTCRSKGIKIKEKSDSEQTLYHIFLQNDEGTQIQIHTKNQKLHDAYILDADYEFKATTTQSTLD